MGSSPGSCLWVSWPPGHGTGSQWDTGTIRTCLFPCTQRIASNVFPQVNDNPHPFIEILQDLLNPFIPENLDIRDFFRKLFTYIVIPFNQHLCNYGAGGKCGRDDRVPVTINNPKHRDAAMSTDMPAHRSRVITNRKH